MNPKTITATQTWIADLFACTNINIGGSAFDVSALQTKTQFQTADTATSKTTFSGILDVDALTTLLGTLTTYYLRTTLINRISGTTLTINGPLSFVLLPNSTATGSITCQSPLTINAPGTSLTRPLVLLKSTSTTVSANSDITLAIGPTNTFNTALLIFTYVATDTSLTATNRLHFGINSGSGLRVFPAYSQATNRITVGGTPPSEFVTEQTVLGTIATSVSFVTAGSATGPTVSIHTTPSDTTFPVREINVCLDSFVLAKGGFLYIQCSSLSGFTDAPTYTGSLQNRTNVGGGTPLYPFEVVNASTFDWNYLNALSAPGIYVYISKFGDVTAATQRSFSSGVVKLTFAGYVGAGSNQELWNVHVSGWSNSFTYWTSGSPPTFHGSGSIIMPASSKLRYFRPRLFTGTAGGLNCSTCTLNSGRIMVSYT